MTLKHFYYIIFATPGFFFTNFKMGVNLILSSLSGAVGPSLLSSSGPAAAGVTPQDLIQKSIAAQVEKIKADTGIELPKYYNPMAINPTKMAEQIQKRRLLWGNKVVSKTLWLAGSQAIVMSAVGPGFD